MILEVSPSSSIDPSRKAAKVSWWKDFTDKMKAEHGEEYPLTGGLEFRFLSVPAPAQFPIQFSPDSFES